MSNTTRQRGPPAAIVQPFIPALQAGAATGVCGFLFGGGIGILRSAHPGLAAIFTGTQCFVLGSSYLYSREVLLRIAFVERTKRADLTASTIAGVISGAAAGAFYGRVNSVAGALFVGTVGHVGQRIVHVRNNEPANERDRRPLMDRLSDSRWFPFKSLSNSDYEKLLTEKLLKVDAEIMMIDDKILRLRQDISSDQPELVNQVEGGK